MGTHGQRQRSFATPGRRAVTNASLLRGCQQGDAGSWNTLVHRYERLVYAIALREGLSDEQAADATQDTFAALLQNLTAIERPERLASWLMTVARRTSWHARDAARSLMPADIEVIDLTNSADELAESLWVYEAIEQLDEPCRTLIQALFFDPTEPSYSEVAIRIGRPLGSVGPLRSRCLVHLRRLLRIDASG